MPFPRMLFVLVSKRKQSDYAGGRQYQRLRHVIPGREHLRASPESSDWCDEFFWIPDQPAPRAVRNDNWADKGTYTAAVVTPPSMTMVWPVMKVEASEAR